MNKMRYHQKKNYTGRTMFDKHCYWVSRYYSMIECQYTMCSTLCSTLDTTHSTTHTHTTHQHSIYQILEREKHIESY